MAANFRSMLAKKKKQGDETIQCPFCFSEMVSEYLIYGCLVFPLLIHTYMHVCIQFILECAIL